MALDTATFDANVETITEGEEAQNALQKAKTMGTERVEDAVDWMRRNPGKTVAIAVALGAAAGALIVSSATEESEPRKTWNHLSDAGREAWKDVRAGAEEALTSAREAIDALSKRFSK